MRTLSGTAGDLLVLVERDLNYFLEDEIESQPQNISNFNDESFVLVDKQKNSDHHSSVLSVDLKDDKKNDKKFQYNSKNKLSNELFLNSFKSNFIFCCIIKIFISKKFI